MNINTRKYKKICILIVCLIFCWFGFLRPDPENKRKFKKTLEVELTPDVEDIHYYGDFFAIDFTILFAFTCDSSTIDRIINSKGLQLAGGKDMGGLSFYFDWWDQEKINTLRPFKKREKNNVYQYLWYDKDNRKAYYQKFSM